MCQAVVIMECAPMNSLIAIPVFNEACHLKGVLDEATALGPDVLVIDDGSTDATGRVLARRGDVEVLTHPINQGYGKSLIDAFEYSVRAGYEVLVTMDADGQHDSSFAPQLIAALADCDIASGSRYMPGSETEDDAPADRLRINRIITGRLNRELGLKLTDAFCGFKAYRTEGLRQLHITETGYAMPLQVWVQAARAGLSVKEIPVPRIYLDPRRAFPGPIRDAEQRLTHYHRIIDEERRRKRPCRCREREAAYAC